MNTSSTAKWPRLERLLLDCDVNVELEPLLKAVGFRTESALRVDVNIKDDTAILAWARKHQYIMVCHDKLKDKQTRVELYPEIYNRGGKIINIGGQPDQDPLTTLGVILVHRKEWLTFFEENDGIVTLHKQGAKLKRAYDLYTVVQGAFDLEREPVRTLRDRKATTQRKKKSLKSPPEQQSLM